MLKKGEHGMPHTSVAADDKPTLFGKVHARKGIAAEP
jgi:hypothetical protein